MFFEQFRQYFIGMCKAVIWFVILVALLFAAYCAVRFLGIAFKKANDRWFHENDGLWLIITAAVIMILGSVFQAIRAVWRARPHPGIPQPRDRGRDGNPPFLLR